MKDTIVYLLLGVGIVFHVSAQTAGIFLLAQFFFALAAMILWLSTR